MGDTSDSDQLHDVSSSPDGAASEVVDAAASAPDPCGVGADTCVSGSDVSIKAIERLSDAATMTSSMSAFSFDDAMKQAATAHWDDVTNLQSEISWLRERLSATGDTAEYPGRSVSIGMPQPAAKLSVKFDSGAGRSSVVRKSQNAEIEKIRKTMMIGKGAAVGGKSGSPSRSHPSMMGTGMRSMTSSFSGMSMPDPSAQMMPCQQFQAHGMIARGISCDDIKTDPMMPGMVGQPGHEDFLTLSAPLNPNMFDAGSSVRSSQWSDTTGTTQSCTPDCSGLPQCEEGDETEDALARWRRLVLGVIECENQNHDELHGYWAQHEDYVRKIKFNNAYVDLWEQVLLNQEQDATRKHGYRGAIVQAPPSLAAMQVACMEQDIDAKDDRPQMSFAARITKIGLDSGNASGYVRYIERTCVIDPQNPVRIGWAVGSLIMMLYDIIMLPMSAFDPPDNAVTDFMSWLSQVFWSIDIFFSFVTGVYVNGELERRLPIIAKLYMTSWFPFDMIVVVPLWIVLIMGADPSMASSMQFFRYVRMLRFLRLARLAKVEQLMQDALSGINSPGLLLILEMIKLMFCLVLVSHLNACMWFAVGASTSNGWTTSYDDYPIFHRYLMSMHWALTQFQGTSELNPGESTGERAYAVCAVLFSLLVLSSFVSSLTNMMMQLQSLHAVKNFQQRAVRSYLSTHNISAPLSARVKKFVEWKQKVQKQNEHNDEVMKILPPQLLMDLQFETRTPVLSMHCFFAVFCKVYPRLTRKVCSVALHLLSPAPEEIIFTPQESGTGMYFVESGDLMYTVAQRRCSTDTQDRETHPMTYGHCISEPCLWMHWQHKGELVVGKFATLLTVHSHLFATLIIAHPPAHVSCVLYARRFIKGMIRFAISVTDIVKPLALIHEVKEEEEEGVKTQDGFLSALSNRISMMASEHSVRRSHSSRRKTSQASKPRDSIGSNGFFDGIGDTDENEDEQDGSHRRGSRRVSEYET